MSLLHLMGCLSAPLIVMAGAQAVQAEPAPVVGPAPDWVYEEPIPALNPANKELPLQVLVSSVQQRIGSGASEIYLRTVAVPQTTAGLQALGNVAIPWNSERTDLTIHHVLLRRGKDTTNLLIGQEFVILRRENNLENSVLDGVRTVVLQVPGLQVGDQIDLAMTQRIRPNSIGIKPESIITVADGAPTGVVERRILIDDRTKVEWRADPSLGVRAEKKGGRTQLTYSRINYVPAKVPENAPAKYRFPAIQLTTYASWNDVAAVMKPLFDKARKPEPASPLLATAAEIAKTNSTPEARMLAALRIAQEQVRYVALTLGEGAYVPATADQTWARKFGDCKGKTAMLLALLDRLGVRAEAMLTSSDASSLLGERLPSLEAFNHIVVKAQIDGRDYVLDPTGYGQRTLAELLLPTFDWGLPLVDGAQLWRIAKTPPSMPLSESDIAWDASKGFDQQVPFTATLTYRDSMASLMRALQANAPDRTALEKYLKDQVPDIDNDKLKLEAIEPEGKNGEFIVRFKGAAPMDWNRNVGGRQYYFDHSVPTWKPDFDRDSGIWKDLPVTMVSPYWSRSSETVTLPRGGAGFTLKAQPVSTIVAGTEIKRSGEIEGGRATVVADFRRLAPEISAQDARAAGATLDRIAKDYAYAMAPKDYVVSRAEVKAIIGQDANGYGEYLERARLLMDQGERMRANGELDKAIKLDAGRATAPALKAINFFMLDRQKEGRPELSKALSSDPDNVDALRAQALFAWYDRDAPLALKAINRAIELDSDYHGHFSIRAKIRAGLGQYDDALVDVRRAVELSADTMSPATIAQIEAASGRTDQALATIDKVIAGGRKDDPYLFVLKGDLLSLQGKKDEAKAAYRQAKDEMRAHMNKRYEAAGGGVPVSSDLELHLLIASRNYDEAEPLADRKIAGQRYPSAKNLSQRAWVRMMNGKYDAAISDARNALGLDPSDERARNSLIMASLRAGKFGEAESQATKALATDKANAQLYYARAIARARLGNAGGADEDLKSARQLRFDVGLDPAFLGLNPN